ncbi:endoglucanase E-4-like [Ptychodera flava]|uniref:endoglucanase E-4-like n=1 Tax=Ptychodera flava TaxID=63121 RepID=UPI00396AAA49
MVRWSTAYCICLLCFLPCIASVRGDSEGVEWPWSSDDESTDIVEQRQGLEEGQSVRAFREVTVTRSTKSYDYSEVLHLSTLFYEAQRSGRLPETNRIPWRGHSALFDQGRRKTDSLVGGWNDAGDNVKFLFPMAYSATVLGWGVIEYPDAYRVAGLTPYVLDSLKWAFDYFFKSHAWANRLYFQVGDAELDHQQWVRPEDVTDDRPAFSVDKDNPGSDVASETSAAMSTCYLIYNETDPDYATTCLDEAKDLYRFATKFQGKYPDTGSYASTGFGDELAWAAAWLYRVTNDTKYLVDAEKYYEEYNCKSRAPAFGWNDKRPGLQLLMYALTGEEDYKDHFTRFMSAWLPGGQVRYTPRGLAWRSRVGPLRYSAAAAFLALVAADLGIETEAYRDFAVNQIHYMLGDSGRSYVVGYGLDPPTRPQHRASSCPDLKLPCTRFRDFRWEGPNHHTLYGALVGGPDKDDSFEDSRNNFAQNSVACDYNAGFQSAVAGIRHLALIGQLREDEPEPI